MALLMPMAGRHLQARQLSQVTVPVAALAGSWSRKS